MTHRHVKTLIFAAALSLTAPAFAQHDMHDMAGMEGMDGMEAPAKPALSSAGSGTAREPGSIGPMGGFHLMSGDWMLMAHATVWGVYSDQSGPRGDNKAFSQSMGMVSAEGPLGDGVRLQLRTMLSLDALMGKRGYPILFAVGETAGGEPLVDRQHPHDFVMEMAGRIDFDVAPDTSLFVYGGPVAEPALGPTAFVHRASARFNPEAPIAHHWFDSTHVTFGVVTAGLSARHFQIEASAFRGQEPDEHRWDIEKPRLDSWSVRGTWNPTPKWSAQMSYGQIRNPEVTHPGEDEKRFTVSASYATGPLAAMVGYSRKNRRPAQSVRADRDRRE